MKPINKEQEQYIANIKGICEAIEENLNDGKTPQEIAEMFGAVRHGETGDAIACEFEEYMMDFSDGFGITFWRENGETDWHWENEDEIWLFEANDWAHWKSL